MLDTYETIELFGLTETADDLVIPNDDILRDKIVRETFENLFCELKGTGLAREIEPLAHGFASVLFRRRQTIGLRPNNRTVSLLTLCGHFPSHIVEGLLRRLVSDRGMASLPVVEDLNVFEDCGLGFRPCFEALLVDQLLFQ